MATNFRFPLKDTAAIDSIALAMRDNFSDISFSLAFKAALDHILVDSVTLSKMFDVSVDDVNAWYDGESFPVQSRRPMILGMLLQSLQSD